MVSMLVIVVVLVAAAAAVLACHWWQWFVGSTLHKKRGAVSRKLAIQLK